MIEIFADPLPPAPLPAQEAPRWTPPAPQAPGEGLPAYRARVLCYALAQGIAGLDLETLTAIDQGAAQAVQTLPGRIDQDETKHLQPLDRQLHELRHAIHARQEAHRRRWAELAAQLQDAAQAPAQAEEEAAQDPDAPPPETDQDRAVRLLRAALILVMDPGQGQDDGGKGARLQRPPTPRPPAAPGLQPPHVPTAGRF